jgi:hypothetical protein
MRLGTRFRLRNRLELPSLNWRGECSSWLLGVNAILLACAHGLLPKFFPIAIAGGDNRVGMSEQLIFRVPLDAVLPGVRDPIFR